MTQVASPRVLFLSGKIKSGKGTVSERLQKLDDDLFIELNFADFLKQVCSDATGIPLADFNDQERKLDNLPKEWWDGDIPITLRRFMQKMGDAMRNGIHKDFFSNVWEKKVKELLDLNENKVIIVQDGRFLNEMKSALRIGALSVRIERYYNWKEFCDAYGINYREYYYIANGFPNSGLAKIKISEIIRFIKSNHLNFFKSVPELSDIWDIITHESEVAMDHVVFNYVLKNNKDLNNFIASIDSFYKNIVKSDQ
jgi:hypothetical protein